MHEGLQAGDIAMRESRGGKRNLRVYVVRQHKGEQNTNATNPLWGIRLKTETTAKEQGNNDI
jgi:hypothetical protein